MLKSELLIKQIDLEPQVKNLIAAELVCPVTVKEDLSLRFKITDSCGMACSFCHNEGTPVANAFQRDTNGRVSIYEATNGVNFTAVSLQTGTPFAEALKATKQLLGLTELHWTGGEPTHNKDIASLTSAAKAEGFTIKMTSNGETGRLRIAELASAGLDSINFSIFGTTPEEIAAVQSQKFANPHYGALKLAALNAGIEESIKAGIEAKANLVICDESDFIRARRVISRFGNSVKLRLLPNLDTANSSTLSIYKLLAELNAEPVSRIIVAGSSNCRTDFILPNGMEIGFKHINRVTLPETCSECLYNNENECMEGYYGIRMYVDEQGTFQIGICIQRMDLTLPLSDFTNSNLPAEILQFRQAEALELKNRYSDYLLN